MMEKTDIIKEFYTCPHCGRPLYSEKRKYFVCPECGSALCEESGIADFDNNYCGNCGAALASARDEVLALVQETGVSD